jgi:hypothetical protein
MERYGSDIRVFHDNDGNTLPVTIKPERKDKLEIGYISMFHGEFTKLIKSGLLTDKQTNILMYLIFSRCSNNNKITLCKNKVAKELSIGLSTLNRALKQFVQLNIFIPNFDKDFGYDYELSPSLGWKGNHEKRVATHNRLKKDKLAYLNYPKKENNKPKCGNNGLTNHLSLVK